jgi:hypothetical protein
VLQGKLATLWRSIPNTRLKAFGWKKAIPAAILLFCLGFLAYKAYASWEALQTYEWEVQYAWLVPSLLLFLIQTFTVIWVWRSMVDRLAPPVPFRKHVKIYCYTGLARRIPASLLWLVAGRGYLYRQLDVPFSASATASLLELELAILVGLPIGTLQLGAVTALKTTHAVLISGLAIGLVAFLIRPDLLNRMRRAIKKDMSEIELSYRDSVRWAMTYTVVWLLGGAGLFAVVRLFYDLPWQTLPEIIGVWTLASLISYLTLLTPGGFGVKELSLTFLLAFYLPEPLPLVVALAIRVLWTVYDIVAGLAAIAL